jgi:hypothetical protein
MAVLWISISIFVTASIYIMLICILLNFNINKPINTLLNSKKL